MRAAIRNVILMETTSAWGLDQYEFTSNHFIMIKTILDLFGGEDVIFSVRE